MNYEVLHAIYADVCVFPISFSHCLSSHDDHWFLLSRKYIYIYIRFLARSQRTSSYAKIVNIHVIWITDTHSTNTSTASTVDSFTHHVYSTPRSWKTWWNWCFQKTYQKTVERYIIKPKCKPEKFSEQRHFHCFMPSFIPSRVQFPLFSHFNGHLFSHRVPENPSLHTHLNSELPIESEQYSVLFSLFSISI